MKNWLSTKQVITINSTATVAEALALMAARAVHHLVLVDASEKAVGLFSERTFFDHMVANPSGDFSRKSIAEFANNKFLSIGEDAVLGECLKLLRESRETSLVVLDRGRAVGIITETDLMAILQDLLGSQTQYPILLRSGAVLSESPMVQKIAEILASLGI